MKKKSKIFGIVLALSMLFGVGACTSGTTNSGESTSQSTEKDREMTNHAVYDGVALPDELWETPDFYYDEENDRSDVGINGSIKALYYRSDYNGTESYAFAFLGVPEGASATNKKPAVLLVHGGGGTAYWQWVRNWVNRGYVALAMDLEGHVPLKTGTSDNAPQDLYVKSSYTAPNNQNYGDAAKPIEQTWMYYAVSTSILGNSLLHSLDVVNKNKVGVCGVSWGGVITSIITGYDDRFAFSVPIYGSLNNAECTGNISSYYKNHPAAKVWDDDEGLSRVSTPILFVDMNNDINFFPDSIMYTAQRCQNAQICFVRNWLHSHTHAFARFEPVEFADGIVNGGQGLIKFKSEPQGTSGTIELSIPKGTNIKSAYLMVTDSDMKSLPSWEYERLSVSNGKITYAITEETKSYLNGHDVTYYYIYVEDELGNVVSTNLVKL